jgi:hypothetical protein
LRRRRWRREREGERDIERSFIESQKVLKVGK